jgi:CRISPR-associated protein Cmr6
MIRMLKEVEDILDPTEISANLRLSRYADILTKEEIENAKREHADIGPVPFKQLDSSKGRYPDYSFKGVKPIVMRLMGRLIMDQAGGVLENANLRLHRHFSCPYIPGSAAKGAARHAAWCAWRDEEDNGKKKEIARKIALTFGYPTGDTMPKKEIDRKREQEIDYLDNYLEKEFPELFGDEKAPYKTFAGTVSFLPAYPSGDYKLVTDVLTCHHMKYYSGELPKAYDNENPNPQFFPAVESGAVFEFQLLPLQRKATLDSDSLFFAEEYLRKGLQLYGIGAKTAAGYGWFETDTEVEQKIAKKLEDAEKEKAERARFESLSPLEQAMEKMKTEDLAGKVNDLESMSEHEQRAIVKLLAGDKSLDWREWKKKAEKGKHKKVQKRVENVRKLAAELGEELP